MSQPPEPAKLLQRFRVIIDPQIEDRKGRIGPDAERTGLTATPVSSCPLARLHRDEKTLVEIEMGCLEIAPQRRVDDLRPRKHVSRDGNLGANNAAAPVQTG